MKYEELKAKFMPRVVASQMEFDEVMRGINHEQTLDNHPLLDETRKLNARQSLIRMQIQSLHAQESAVKTERIHIEQVQKDINRAYHQLKKDWIACNPKQPRIGGGGQRLTTIRHREELVWAVVSLG